MKYLCSRRYKEVFKTKNRDPNEKIAIFEQENEIMTVGDKQIKVYPYTQDPLSVIYFLSSVTLEKGKSITLFINAGKTNNKLRVKVRGKDKINIKGKDYLCWKLTGEYFKLKKGEQKYADVSFWVEASSEQKLILMKAATKLGMISLEHIGNN